MSTLVEILQTKLIPWSQQNSSERFIVARSKMSSTNLPYGVQLKRRSIHGKRVIIKNQRNYNNTRGVSAIWPDAGLNEVSKLKLVCVFGGNIDYQLDNYSLRCGQGNFIFIPPGLPHPDGSCSYIDTTKSTFCTLLFFMLHPNAVECWVRHYDGEGAKQGEKYIILHERIIALFRTLMEEVIEGDDKSLLVGGELLPGFFIMLERELKAGRCHSVRSNARQWLNDDTKKRPGQDDFTEQLKHYLQANLQKGLTLEKVAKEMYLSRAQFARIVRRETGQTFNALLTAYRLEESKVLLRQSQWTVTTISYFVGFKSPSYFRTFFHKHVGQTPTEYREHIGKTSIPKN